MRVPFRFTPSIGAAVGVLCVAVAHAAFAAANRPARVPMPQYNVLFSRDDNLCSTLRDFYNRHVGDRDSLTAGYLEDQFGREMQRSGAEFLSESKDWQPQGDVYWTQEFPAIDIYNDGSSRAVIILDGGLNYSGFLTFKTQILVLKPGVDIAGVQERLRFDRDFVEQVIDFDKGGSSISPQSGINSYYGINEIPPTKIRNFRGELLPHIVPAQNQRLMRFQNRVYGVARWQADGLPHESFGIFAYAVARSGMITDVCYLETQSPLPKK